MRFGQTRFIIGFLTLPVVVYVVFVLSPLVQAFYYSLTDWTGCHRSSRSWAWRTSRRWRTTRCSVPR